MHRLFSWTRQLVAGEGRPWLDRLPYYGFVILLCYMPFHVFLAQWVSTATGGLEIWKIAKDVVLFLFVLFTICLVGARGQGSKRFYWLVGFAATYAALHVVLWLAHPGLYDRSSELGAIYNNRLLGFAILGYGASLLWPSKFAFSPISRLIIGISTVVVVLGIVQYFLPTDVMTHFGYSLARGARPAFEIDSHPGLTRIMSTLREPNALGAYLLVPIGLLVWWLGRIRTAARRWMLAVLLALHLLALVWTQSRSAVLAAGVVTLAVLYWQHRATIQRVGNRYWPLVLACVLFLLVAGWTQRNGAFFQRYINHSEPSEISNDIDSNGYHWLLIEEGLRGIRQEPLGHGPGTAGIVSIQNPGGGQLTENYYIQIGYEVGVAGMAAFVGLTVVLLVYLWRRRDPWGTVLCATGLGYVLTNMLLHTWSNEAVAAQWWMLVGAVLAMPLARPGKAKPQTKDLVS